MTAADIRRVRRRDILIGLRALLFGSIVGGIIGIWTWNNDDGYEG